MFRCLSLEIRLSVALHASSLLQLVAGVVYQTFLRMRGSQKGKFLGNPRLTPHRGCWIEIYKAMASPQVGGGLVGWQIQC